MSISELKCINCAHFYKFKNQKLFPTVRAFCRKHRIYLKEENKTDYSDCKDFQPLISLKKEAKDLSFKAKG